MTDGEVFLPSEGNGTLHFARNRAMATPASYRVFLSAVTRELGTYWVEVV